MNTRERKSRFRRVTPPPTWSPRVVVRFAASPFGRPVSKLESTIDMKFFRTKLRTHEGHQSVGESPDRIPLIVSVAQNP